MSNRIANTSHAVRAQRNPALSKVDDFPSPPWSVRALCEHVLPAAGYGNLGTKSVWEPAANRGFMVRPLAEYFQSVTATDMIDYGAGYPVLDFLETNPGDNTADAIVTNPPFAIAESFVQHALACRDVEIVAMLARTVFLESVGRFDRLFSTTPPAIVAPFTERVPMFEGRISAVGSTATSYSWFLWRTGSTGGTKVVWIPPCRKALERDGDYA